ncbi:MAG TPA: 5'/3'-nucleotidase SurE, partial [Vicinamibacterales bacterium]|nr:5'/3'-nucleotidase SurE [Vicinamibacterales bacterium]
MLNRRLRLAALCVVLTAPLSAAPYRILVANDDGVRAAGILAVAKALQAIGEVTIIAPAENQSGKGHS